jgi:FixJ family two-component response regulator
VDGSYAAAIVEQSATLSQMAPSTCVIVDDDVDMRAILTRVARMAALEAESFDSAEAFLRRGGLSGIDCLLLDVDLGGMTGVELLTLLAEPHTPFPVFLLSGAHDAQTCAEARRVGAVVVDKPFDTRQLAEKIRSAVGSH